MGRTGWHLAVIAALVALSACGKNSSSSPTSPSSSGALMAPQNFRITYQRVFFTYNEVQMSWTGNGTSYRVTAGTAHDLSDLLTAETTATSYTWTAPREEGTFYVRVAAIRGSEVSGNAIELPVFTIDLRNVIDALFFRSGPMADTPSNALSNPYAAVWPDGTSLQIVVSQEAGDLSRNNADIFTSEFAAIWGGGPSATSSLDPNDFHSLTLSQVAPYHIMMRVLGGFCGSGAIACAYYGPSPIGPDKSIVTQNTTGGYVAIAHEVGHAYGLGHVHVNASVRQELNFLMNPSLVSTQMTEPEKNAIAAARAGGIAPGWRRDQALATGLVLPYTGSVFSASGAATISSLPRAPSRCTIKDPVGPFPLR